MSRWWPDRATMWLAPHKGQDALACAEQALERRAPRPRTRLTWVLGGPLVRYRMVPWSDALSSPAQRQVLATSCFTEAYGPAALAWTVRAHSVRFGAASLACAIDTALLDGLAVAAEARRLHLASVQSSLMHAYNHLRTQMPAGMFWFVWEEGPYITLMLISRGEPLYLKTLPSTPVQLASLLDREWFLAALDAPRCPVYLARAAGSGLVQNTVSTAWHIVALPEVVADVAHDAGASVLRAA